MVGYVLMQLKKVTRWKGQVCYLSNGWKEVTVTKKEVRAGGLWFASAAVKVKLREKSLGVTSDHPGAVQSSDHRVVSTPHAVGYSFGWWWFM